MGITAPKRIPTKFPGTSKMGSKKSKLSVQSDDAKANDNHETTDVLSQTPLTRVKTTHKHKKHKGKKKEKKKIKVRVKKNRRQNTESPILISEPTAPAGETPPDLVTDSERASPDLERVGTIADNMIERTDSVDTRDWLARDQELHKQQVRASLWSETSSLPVSESMKQ